MSKNGRKIYIDNRVDAYEGFLSTEWANKITEKAKPSPALAEIVLDLLLDWRTCCYTAAMPTVFAQSIQTYANSYTNAPSNDRSVMAYSDTILKLVSRKVPELVEDSSLRTRLASALVNTAAEVRDAKDAVKINFDLEEVWNNYLGMAPFQMLVWSTQRVAYVALFNAYDSFLQRCVKRVSSRENLRTTDRDFRKVLRECLGDKAATACWTSSDFNTVRLVRHALSHAGGRETDKLSKQEHGIVVQDGVLQIWPEHNKSLLEVLKKAVGAMVAATVSMPEFMATT